MKKSIRLTPAELGELRELSFSEGVASNAAADSRQTGDVYVVQLTDDEIADLSDACARRLQAVGFDTAYRPTPRGMLLESLVDKLSLSQE
ncbi:MAG: hypothetical protein U0Q12_03160 [Vicinamibacterales bacterium]